jgi:hypothetical protein
MLYMKTQMKRAAGLLILLATLFAGCRTAHDVAVTSFRVIDTPASYIRRQIDEEPTTTFQSDAAAPGHPLATPPSSQRIVSEHRLPSEPSPESRGSRHEPSEAKPSPSASQRTVSTRSSKIPYAKPVPGKPGFVYSLDPNGGYVDVTGIPPGTKMKDPYTHQIFVVP